MDNRDLELSIVKNIKDNNYKIDIIINDEIPYTLYKSSDIGKLLGLKNIRETIKNFDKDEKILKSCLDKINRKQKTLFLTYNGLLHLISMSKKVIADDFAKNIGINIKSYKYNSVEIETLQHIQKAFNNEEMIFQYQVNKYRIDLYFPKYKIAIECDENHHNNQLINDISRENDIKELIKDCIFIRYKPYDKNFNIFELINKIYITIINSSKHITSI